MSKIKNSGLDQYGVGPFEQEQFGTAGVEGLEQRTASQVSGHQYLLSIELLEPIESLMVSRIAFG